MEHYGGGIFVCIHVIRTEKLSKYALRAPNILYAPVLLKGSHCTW